MTELVKETQNDCYDKVDYISVSSVYLQHFPLKMYFKKTRRYHTKSVKIDKIDKVDRIIDHFLFCYTVLFSALF